LHETAGSPNFNESRYVSVLNGYKNNMKCNRPGEYMFVCSVQRGDS
jgi:hypothetical protein